MTEIKCILPFNSFVAGSKVVFYLVPSNEVHLDPEDLVLFVQFHGHIQIDKRWLKNNAKQIVDAFATDTSSLNNLDHTVAIPVDPTVRERKIDGLQSHCLFTTSKIPVSPSQILDTGLFIETELPMELFSSYRGRSMIIQYFLTITLQQGDRTRYIHYPVAVYRNRLAFRDSRNLKLVSKLPWLGGIISYSPSLRPVDTFYNNINILKTSQEIGTNSLQSPPSTFRVSHLPIATYKVSDLGCICHIHVFHKLFPIGEFAEFILEFSEQTQNCQAVRATLLQVEKEMLSQQQEHVIQERAIWTCLKYAEYAEELNLRVLIPDGTPASFTTPFIKVEYFIQFEFFFPVANQSSTDGAAKNHSATLEESNREPMSFRVGIEVTPPKNIDAVLAEEIFSGIK